MNKARRHSSITGPRAALILGLMAIVPAPLFAGDSTVSGPLVTDDGSAAATGGGGGDAEDLAKKLQNPIASLISVPFQNNFDFGAGPNGDGFQWKMNFQPVVPIDLNEDWNLIWRTILPVISQEDVTGTKANPSGSQTGLGDTSMSLFFSPKEPTAGGLVWGVGPALLLPTATDDLLGTDQWAAGPTFVALKQSNGWTYGALVSHLWSFAGDDSRADVNLTALQPFLSYTTSQSTTFGLNTESTYNWESEQWTIPINLSVAQLVKLGDQPMQFQVGARWYAEAPDEAPNLGLRAAVTFLF
jgi:hypothetical protein